MTGISLGFRAGPLTAILADDTDFVSALLLTEAWPDGTEIALEFDTSPVTTWLATIADTRASWYIPASQVASVIASTATDVRLRYTDPDGVTLVWFRGAIVRDPS